MFYLKGAKAIAFGSYGLLEVSKGRSTLMEQRPAIVYVVLCLYGGCMDLYTRFSYATLLSYRPLIAIIVFTLGRGGVTRKYISISYC